MVSKAFKDEVDNSFKGLVWGQEDIFVISFYAWLKTKMENEDIYKVTLKLVGSPTL